jgi:hypothetical protein
MALAGNDRGDPVGALTGENRDVWTDVGGHSHLIDATLNVCNSGTGGAIGSLASERQVVGADRVCCDHCLSGRYQARHARGHLVGVLGRRWTKPILRQASTYDIMTAYMGSS